MPKIKPFQEHCREYEEWFDDYPFVYEAELKALRSQMPESDGDFLEIGVGSGKFAKALNIATGIDPCVEMLDIARGRGIKGVLGAAENLPFEDNSYDCVVMITVLCFLDDPVKAYAEIKRVLKKGGRLVLAFVDRLSHLGELYCRHQHESTFYKDARFYSVAEVTALFEQAGFVDLTFKQTIFKPLKEVGPDEPITDGSGQGSFVVVAGAIF